jgi:hypothetical protein
MTTNQGRISSSGLPDDDPVGGPLNYAFKIYTLKYSHDQNLHGRRKTRIVQKYYQKCNQILPHQFWQCNFEELFKNT